MDGLPTSEENPDIDLQEATRQRERWRRVRRFLLALSTTLLLLSYACLNGARHTNRLLLLLGFVSLIGGLLALAVGVIIRPLRKGR